jgi:hypothetical protein
MSSPKRFALITAIAFAFGSWYYLLGVFVPFHHLHEPANLSWNNRSDLYPRWVGTRALILQGRNPYSAEVTGEIQVGYYGRTVDTAKAAFPSDEQRFIYPVFVAILLAPVAQRPFSEIQDWAAVFLFFFTVASVWLWMKALNLTFSPTTLWIATLFTIGSWPVAEGLYEQQLSLLVAFLLAAAAAAAVRGRPLLAGMSLAISLIKPSLGLPLILWLLLNAVRNWRIQKALLIGFAATLGIMLMASERLLPHWFWYWRTSLPAYIAYTGSRSSLERLFGGPIAIFASAVVVIMVVIVGWRSAEAASSSRPFGYTCSLVLAATLVLLPTWSLASYNEVLLLPAVLWFCSEQFCSTQKRKFSLTRRVVLLAFACGLLWEPLADLALAIEALVRHRLPSNEITLSIPQSFYFVLPLLTLAMLLVLRPSELTTSRA